MNREFDAPEQPRLRETNLIIIMTRLKYLSKTFGIHPLTALLLFVVDWMLFGEEVATGGIGWVISLPIGIMLGLVAMQIQKRMYNDDDRPARAKGLVVALLTAIPAPLSSLGLLPLAAFGAVRVLFPDRGRLTGQSEPYTAEVPATSRHLAA